jgi:exodeoxyribonuclease VII small subunit
MAEPVGFEAALAALEDKVRRLESPDVSLDQALAWFEEGLAHAAACHAQLDAAEARVAALVRGTSGIASRPLPEPGEPEGAL